MGIKAQLPEKSSSAHGAVVAEPSRRSWNGEEELGSQGAGLVMLEVPDSLQSELRSGDLGVQEFSP